MKTTFLIPLILCVVINILVGEVIEIEATSETRKPNASAILDMAILQNNNNSNIDNLNTSNSTDLNNSRNFVSSTDSRTPKSFQSSVNLPAKAHLGVRQIPAGQWMYTAVRTGNPVKLNKTESNDNSKSDADEDIYVEERDVPLVSKTVNRHREERRKFDGINRQYSVFDENTHGPTEDYEIPDNHYSGLNSESQAEYASHGSRYESESYNSYFPDSTNDNQYYGKGSDFYNVGSGGEAFRRPRPINSLYSSRYTVNSSPSAAYHQDPASRGGTTPTLIGIFFSIGSNLLQLFKIALGSGLSILLPIIAIKLFLIPLKIFKFIKIVKIILKLVFVVPFILRVFAPGIYSQFGHRESGLSDKIDGISNSESRNDVEFSTNNSTSWFNDALPDFVSSQKCPSRVACELGSYLATSNNISDKLVNFLNSNSFEESKDFNDERNEKEEVTRAFIKAFTQRWDYHKCEVFACGFSL